MTDELFLNILPPPEGATVKQKKHTARNRKLRIAKRRRIKKQNLRKEQKKANAKEAPVNDATAAQATEVSRPPDTNNNKTVAKKKKAQAEKSPAASKPRDARKPTVVSSSLFSSNPEIPSIETKQPATKRAVADDAPKTSFQDMEIDAGLKSYVVDKMQLSRMTEVQSSALPHLLNGADVLIRSPTGTGKTIAYSLAVVQNLLAIEPPVTRQDGVLALVLVPTRELALQTFQVFQRLSLPVRRLVPTCVIGGQKRKSEKARLRKGANVVVSTPGRLLDHLQNTKCMSLANVGWLVFDEADRLLDMGFQTAINGILNALKQQSEKRQQVVLLSATLTKGVETLVDLALTEPVRIEVNREFGVHSDNLFVDPLTGLRLSSVPLPDKLDQFVALVPSKLRLVSLLAFVNRKCVAESRHKVVAFFSCRDSVSFHRQVFARAKSTLGWGDDVGTFALHGGLTQEERTRTIAAFHKVATASVLLCTDVAARGLDIPRVDWVVQYTSPGSPVDYIHRVGRTARAGKEGKALLLLTPAEAEYVKVLTSFDIRITELKTDDMLSGLLDRKANKINYNVRLQMGRERAAEIQSELEGWVVGDLAAREVATRAFMSFVRAYATYPVSLKHIFHVRHLHLGHVAKSFALQQTPSSMLTSLEKTLGEKQMQVLRAKLKSDPLPAPKPPAGETSTTAAEKPAAKRKAAKHPVVAKYDLMSEFSSGIELAMSSKLRKLQ